MADLQQCFEQYKSQHQHAPNATQLAKFAGVKYSEASKFLRNTTPSSTPNRSATVSVNASSANNRPSRSISLHNNTNQKISSQSSETPSIDYSGSTTGINNPWKKFQNKSSTHNASQSPVSSTKKAVSPSKKR